MVLLNPDMMIGLAAVISALSAVIWSIRRKP
jgi:hypothetical protein